MTLHDAADTKKAHSREHSERLQIALVAFRGLSFERYFTPTFRERFAEILTPIFEMWVRFLGSCVRAMFDTH